MTVNRLRRINRIREDVDLLSARHALDHVRGLVFELDAAFDLVRAGVMGGRAAVELAIEGFLLDEAEAAGLEEIVAGVDVFDGVAGAGSGTDGVFFLVAGVLSGEKPGR